MGSLFGLLFDQWFLMCFHCFICFALLLVLFGGLVCDFFFLVLRMPCLVAMKLVEKYRKVNFLDVFGSQEFVKFELTCLENPSNGFFSFCPKKKFLS